MLAGFNRRVSFDSLSQNREFEPDTPLHIPPQYENLKNNAQNKYGDHYLDLGYSSSTNHDVYQIFNSFNEIGKIKNNSPSNHVYITRKKVPKLPPAPNKSILKNNHHTIPTNNEITKKINDPFRKKSIVEMTTEELLAMDQQFRTGINLDNLKFDGDGYLPFFQLNNIDSKKPNSYKKIDKLFDMKSINKKGLDFLNLNSYTVSFKHSKLDQFISEKFDKEDDDNEIIPDNLRSVMLYISGRKHTWDSIIWSFKNYLQDGDHLVIICHIPSLHKNSNTALNKSGLTSPTTPIFKIDEDDDVYDDDDAYHWDDVDVNERIKEISSNLMFYISNVISSLKLSDLKISITLEFIQNDSLKQIIKNSIVFHEPSVFLLGSLLTNLNVSNYNEYYKNRNIKLPIYLEKHLNLPLVIIPSLLIEKKSITIGSINDDDNDDDDNNETYDNGSILTKLNKFSDSIENNKDYSAPEIKERFNNYTYTTSTTTTTSTTSNSYNSKFETARDPTSYFPQQPSIKFSDNLQVPRASSLSNSRRNSNNSQIYKVKSLLDDDSIIERSKSNETKKSVSSSSIPLKKIKSEEVKPKKGFFGLFKKKK